MTVGRGPAVRQFGTTRTTGPRGKAARPLPRLRLIHHAPAGSAPYMVNLKLFADGRPVTSSRARHIAPLRLTSAGVPLAQGVAGQIVAEAAAKQQQSGVIGDLGKVVKQTPHARMVSSPDSIDEIFDDFANANGYGFRIEAHTSTYQILLGTGIAGWGEVSPAARERPCPRFCLDRTTCRYSLVTGHDQGRSHSQSRGCGGNRCWVQTGRGQSSDGPATTLRLPVPLPGMGPDRSSTSEKNQVV